ncbi:hypothetical protein [Paenibacillus sp. XY044]|uniref:hypothetical protein n=1 Tax=Paenibacillus sp. XY044 TaxID=2026089 RepID=UPI000B99802F|nr:hypothetical protein [Paenibacillus sp. XY044]OZB98093.1 hypothetical protein CJP46_02695 [Paenibacillus sp. XY044]
MDLFFARLKEYMINNDSFEEIDRVGYYHTLEQQKENLHELLSDCNTYDFSFEFDRTGDVDSYYSPGKIIINLYDKSKIDDSYADWERQLNHFYTVDFGIEERYWGYCTCQDTDEGFNYVHRCCGNGCDWVAPKLSVTKHQVLTHGSFNGIERDLWKLQEQWTDNQEESDKREKEAQIKYIQDQIDTLNKKKEALL